MSFLRKLRRGLQVLTNRPAADRELDEEVDHYFDELAASYEAKGFSPAAARRKAGIQKGSALALRDEVRDAGWENWVSGIIDDCRYAFRRMRRSPGFTITAVLTVALGIGATAAIFTVTDGVLLKPLSFPHSERLVALVHTAPGINLDYLKMSPSLYFTYREEGRVF